MGGASLTLLMLAFSVAHGGCGLLEPAVVELESAVFDGRFNAVADVMKRVDTAISCDPATPTLLARAWLAEGASLLFTGDERGAADSLAAAVHLAPSVWTDDYGPRVREVWQTAAENPRAEVSIDLTPRPERYIVRIDGVGASLPALLPSGLHAVQVVHDDQAVYGRVVMVVAGSEVVLRTGVVEEPEPVEPPELSPVEQEGATDDGSAPAVLPSAERKLKVGWLAVGGSGLAVGTTAVVYAQVRGASIGSAQTVKAVDQIRTEQEIATGVMWGSMAAASAGFILTF